MEKGVTPLCGPWRMENGECKLPFCRPHVVRIYAQFTRSDSSTVSLHVKEATPGEKQEACGETFSENSPFFTRGGEEVRFSILREWALRHSRRGCHIIILRPLRMGGKRCDNPY